MKKIVMCICFILFALMLYTKETYAIPVYEAGNECPSDASMTATPTYTRQYYVTQATACVYDPGDKNIQGTDAEALFYLDGGPQLIWGDGWEGAGQNPIANGFSYTADAGNDDGTFMISGALAAAYDQFAIGIKDGQNPYWAIFLLPVLTFSGDWGFGTQEGSLSHFALYGRVVGGVINPNCTVEPCNPPPPPPPIAEVPEPASLFLMGTGIMLFMRNRVKNHK
jgi:hypothetical protein